MGTQPVSFTVIYTIKTAISPLAGMGSSVCWKQKLKRSLYIF